MKPTSSWWSRTPRRRTGATYRGEVVGSLGDTGAFSLQTTKNLPTCGEGGLVTTDDATLAGKIRMARQFGEIVEPGRPRDYVSYTLGRNAKLNPVQAGFAASQPDRFDDYEQSRQANIRPFVERLSGLPGITVPAAPKHAGHAWHILRFRFDPAAMGLPDVAPATLRNALRRLLRAEGVPLSQQGAADLGRHRHRTPGRPVHVHADEAPDGGGFVRALREEGEPVDDARAPSRSSPSPALTASGKRSSPR